MISGPVRALLGELSRRLLARRPGDPEAVSAALGEALAQVEGEHPDWPVSPEDFVDALAERLPAGPPEPWLRQLRARELYQALCAARGEARALEALERQSMPRVRAALFRLGASPSDVEEAVQRLRDHALAPEGGQPARIAGYAGQGPLSSWLTVVAARLWLKEARRRRPGAPGAPAAEPLPDEALDRLIGSLDPEVYRQETRPALQAAFQRAMATLSERHRTLLRLSALDGLNGEQIGTLYGVDRPSVAQWLQQCRSALSEAMLRELHAEGLDSLSGQLLGQLDLSLSRVLGEDLETTTT